MIRGLVLTVIGLSATTAFAAGSQPMAVRPCKPHSVNVSGQGSVNVEPAVYRLYVAVSRRGTDVRAARALVDKIAAEAVTAARSAGLSKADIQSTMITISPIYKPEAKPGTPQTFEVRRDLTLTLRQPAQYAELVEGLTRAGINQISHVSAEPSDPRATNDRALKQAVADARHKAALIATGLGVALGPPLEVTENGAQGPRPVIMGAARTNGRTSGYEPGRITVRASVSARFALSPSGCPVP